MHRPSKYFVAEIFCDLGAHAGRIESARSELIQNVRSDGGRPRGRGASLSEDFEITARIVGPAARLAGLLDRVSVADRAAFEELYRLTSAKLFGVCLRILPNRQEAEDALQDAYLTIWQRAARFDRDRGSAIAWLSVIARNAAIDRLRRRRPTAGSESYADIADTAPLAHEQMTIRQDSERLSDCLDGLDLADAEFLRTAFFQGMTYADLAARENLPLGTVKSRIRRALLKLRGRLI